MTHAYPLPPKTRTIRPPADGWKKNTYYVVAVSFAPTNPVHKAIFFSGFLGEGGRWGAPSGEPSGYNQAWNPTWERGTRIENLHFLAVLAELPYVDDLFESEAEALGLREDT